MADLKVVRKRLVARKEELDKDVPNHGYDSALAMSAQAGGIEEAINIIDEEVKRKPTNGKKFKLDGS